MTGQNIDVIFTPPPTPNSGLHVGHIAGPYLRADLNRRLLDAVGSPAAHVSHIDNYQTYVTKKAQQLGREANQFRDEMTAQIRSDFKGFGIHFDQSIDNTSDAYRAYLASGLAELFDNERAIRQPEIIGQDTRYGAVEAFVSGTCPNCLNRAFINVCENCGNPMDLARALSPVEESTGCTEFVQVNDARVPTAFMIDYQDIAWLQGWHLEIDSDSPSLVRLIRELEPSRVALTFRSEYGHMVTPGRVVNPWFEIFFAHCYALGQLLGLSADLSFGQLRTALSTADRRPWVTYYFGFDNSFYYGALFPLLAHILDVPSMMPDTLKANRFLKVDGVKMSSSQGNAIWARDLASRYPATTLRGALAAVSPEVAELDFRDDMLTAVSSWPAPSDCARAVFESPATLTGKNLRSTLELLSCPERFSVSELLNRICNAVQFAESPHAFDAERVELTGMVAHLRNVLEI